MSDHNLAEALRRMCELYPPTDAALEALAAHSPNPASGTSEQQAGEAQPTEAATIAGLESAGGHLAALVDEAQVLMTELREYARDLEKETLGGESERGEVSLLDRVDDWLDARPAAPSAQAEPQQADTVTLVGVKADGTEHVLGTATMPPKMKARELVREMFGNIDEETGDGGAMALWVCEQLIEWMDKTPPVVTLTTQAEQGGK